MGRTPNDGLEQLLNQSKIVNHFYVVSLFLTSILHDHINGKLWLAPPQFWEISRIANLSSFDNLKDFSMKREMKGCETWLPILKFCTDGHYSIYPGDDLYPEEPDYVGDKNQTIA